MGTSGEWADAELSFLKTVDAALDEPDALDAVLRLTLGHFATATGTIHVLHDDGLLHLAARGPGIPDAVLERIRTIPVGKGMAGLAVERKEPVSMCNLQTDSSGDARPGALQTGLRGTIVVPAFRGSEPVGAIGIGEGDERTFSDAEARLLLEVGRRIAGRVG